MRCLHLLYLLLDHDRRHAFLGVLLLCLGALGTPAQSVHAAGIVVNTLADANPAAADGLCSLREAMTNANANTTVSADCTGGAGADLITFAVSGTILLAAPLPDVNDPNGLVIDGTGQSVTVSGANAVRPFTVTSPLGPEPFSLLTLNALTIRDGNDGIGSIGGIYVEGRARLTLTNSRVVGNAGTAIGVSQAHATIANSTIEANTGTGFDNIFHGTTTITNSTIRGNAGRGVANYRSGLTISGSTISGNLGGGIQNFWASVAVVNSTISGNTAESGAGIHHGRGRITLTNSTVTVNVATASGGGATVQFPGGIIELANSILGGNTAPSAPDCDTLQSSSGTVESVGRNLVGDGSGCTITGSIPLSGAPKLGSLQDNGGPTQTHALLPGSPAAGIGDALVCASAPVSGVDQRGVVRPQGFGCDLGAFESATVGAPGGRHLRITAGSLHLSWDPGATQTGYTLLTYNTSTTEASLDALPATATQYFDLDAADSVVYCYVLATLGPGSALLGLSDLLCGMTGLASGTILPQGFTLKLGGTSQATMTWVAPVAGADTYLLQRIPLDGTSITTTPLTGDTTMAAMPVPPAGACFQLIAFNGAAFGTTEVLCGVPGVSTLGSGSKTLTAADALGEVRAKLASVRFTAPVAVP